MGQIMKRKKKGRPSKADLARRASNSGEAATESDLRRSRRRRNVRYNIDYDDYLDDDEEFEEDEDERRREKKLKLVLKLNQSAKETESTPPSCTRVAARERASLAEGMSEEEEDDEEESERKVVKKRRINGGDGIDEDDEEEEEEEEDGEDERGRRGNLKGLDSVPGTPSDPPSGVPLPDKKSLELILDKLQKKDIYGVYAEPVDPEELPDYHDIIEHPMDFATVRKKLANGSYSTLEQFESDIFLICSNAMQYNSSETIYHKQACSIQELARKKFLRLRIDIERSEKEVKSEQKSRSNFLVKKQMKKPLSQTAQELIGSDFSSGATLATAGDVQNSSNPTQAGSFERPSNTDGPVEGNVSLIDTSLEKAEELLSGKGLLSKFGRKQFVLDENRRTTYNIPNQPVAVSESIFTTFEGDIKQLVAVGLHAEYSYARSLARFAASLGPVAWKVASQRIEQALPAGCKFGRGWVGEYEPLPTPVLMIENHFQNKSALVSKLQCIADARKDNKALKTSVPAKDYPVSAPTTNQKQFMLGSTGTKSITPVNTTHQQQNLPSRNFAEPENKVLKQVELNSPPSANLKNADLVAEKQISSKSEMTATRSREMLSRNINILRPEHFKQQGSNGFAAGAGGLANGKVTNNSSDTSRTITPFSDGVPNLMTRAATYFPHGQEPGPTDPVRLMRTLSEKTQNQQNTSIQSPADTPPVIPLVPIVRRDNSTNAAAAAARAWMSIGAGGLKQATENSNMQKHQIFADSLYNPTRELHTQMLQVRGEFPLSRGLQFMSEKNSFPPQAFALQPAAQFQNRPMIFPQLVAADLSRFQMQSPWQALSPHSQQRQKQETLPPDLNIGFQSPGSPARQSSGVPVDPQQPDLALQL